MDDRTLEQRLATIEATQARTIALLESLSEQVCDESTAAGEWRAGVDLKLHGDGNGHRGLLVRIDRLEQDHDRARWMIRALVGAVLALGAHVVAGLLHG